MRERIHPLLLFLLIIVMGTVGVISNDLFSPAMPHIPVALHTTKPFVQLTVTAYMLAFSVAQLFYGPISDRLGRRPVVLTGFLIAWLGTWLCYLAQNDAMLMAGRAVQGLGIASGVVMYRAIMRDVYGKWARLSRFASYVMIAIAAILMVSLVMGGYLQQYFGWRANFFFMLCYILVFFILIWFTLPETNRRLHHQPLAFKSVFHRYLGLLKSKQFFSAGLMAGLSYGGFLIYLIESPFLLQGVVGLTPVEYGWSAFAIAGCLALGNLLNSLIVARVGTYAMLLIGAVLMLAASVCMLLGYWLGYITAAWIILPGAGFVLGAGLLFENATSTALSPFPEIAGTAGATYGFIQILVASALSAVISIPHAHNQKMLSGMLVAAGVFCLVLTLLFVDRRPTDAGSGAS